MVDHEGAARFVQIPQNGNRPLEIAGESVRESIGRPAPRIRVDAIAGRAGRITAFSSTAAGTGVLESPPVAATP